MTNSPYLENRKWSRIKIQKNQICLMLPVVTCLDVASSDANRTKNCDIYKWWESLRNISQNLLPESSALEVTIPRVYAWTYWISAVIISWRKQLFEKTKTNRNTVLSILPKPFRFLYLIAVATSAPLESSFRLSIHWLNKRKNNLPLASRLSSVRTIGKGRGHTL